MCAQIRNDQIINNPGEDGFEISVANNHALNLTQRLLSHEEVLPIGLGARDSLRLEAGLCLYGHELSSDITAVEANLSWPGIVLR
jgi:aminomethyltransferase